MFTIEQIHEAEKKVQSGKDFPQLAKDLKKLGVTRFDVFVINGMATYYGTDDFVVQGSPVYEDLLIEPESSTKALEESIQKHQAGETTYQTFCKEVALAGVERWVVDLEAKTVTYFASEGAEILVEEISF